MLGEEAHLGRWALWLRIVLSLGSGWAGAFLLGDSGFVRLSAILGFKMIEDGLRPTDDVLGKACESGDLDAVAAVGGTGDDLAEKDDLFVPLTDGHIVVLHARAALSEGGDFVVVGGKQGARLDGVVDVFGDTPSNGKAVKGGRAASDFIKHDEASVGGVVDDASRLVHLDHECGLTTGEIVIGTHPGEDAVHETDLRLGRRNEATYLCH